MNILKQMCKRRADGKLLFPRAVRAHLATILTNYPDALTAEEIQNLQRYDEPREI